MKIYIKKRTSYVLEIEDDEATMLYRAMGMVITASFPQASSNPEVSYAIELQHRLHTAGFRDTDEE